MLGLLLRLVALFLLIRFVLRAFASFLRPPPRPAAFPGGRPPAAARDLVRDRVCNTFVPRDRTLVATIDGREEHFCSEACRDRARALATKAAS